MSLNLQPIKDVQAWFSAAQQYRFANNNCKVTCVHGCSACCSEALPVFSPEMEVALSELTPEQLEYVKGRTAAWLKKADWLVKEPNVVNAIKYRAHGMVCPFLKDNQCLCYQNRPLGCRNLLAKGPRKNCEDLKLRPKQTFWQTPELVEEGYRRLNKAIREAYDMPEGQLMVEHTHMGFLLAAKFGLSGKAGNVTSQVTVR